MTKRTIRPSVVVLLRAQPLLSAARTRLSAHHNSAYENRSNDGRGAKCNVHLVTTAHDAEQRLAATAAALLLVEIDELELPTTQADTQTSAALRWLQAQHESFTNLQSIVFSQRRDAATVVAALCAGATGYLVNDTTSSPTEQVGYLFNGLQKLANGKPPLSDVVIPHIVQAARASQKFRQSAEMPLVRRENKDQPKPATDDARLSKREKEVLALAAKGFTYAEMATLLSLSVHTINTHTRRIYTKLEVNSRCAAIYEARQQGLLLDRTAA